MESKRDQASAHNIAVRHAARKHVVDIQINYISVRIVNQNL